jgi:nuclear transport factor 2 (NTF2) superfamily protein
MSAENAMSQVQTKESSIRSPFTLESAELKVQAAEDAWNSRDPERVAPAYTPDSEWRNRTESFRWIFFFAE